MQWLNGALRPQHEARLPASSAGTLLGWGIFTTLGVREGRPLLLARHLERLRRDAAALQLELPFSDDALRDGLLQLLRAEAVHTGLARLTVTARGDGLWHCEAGSDVAMLARSRPVDLAPLRVGISPFRAAARGALAGVKSTSYAAHLRAWRAARERSWDEALLLTESGALCEASRANGFWARGGELFTPALSTGCLPGIARQWVLEWCGAAGIAAHEGQYPLEELGRADEMFVTSSTVGPRPVTALHQADAARSFAAPGPLTQRLMEAWRTLEE